MAENEDIPFSKEMRQITREAHDLSDALVNAKLAFALTDNRIWAEGLLIFYEIFKYLEEKCPDRVLPKEFHRTDAFEKDLAHFLGVNWKINYTPRQAVQDYVDHLEEVHKEDSILLVAYVYHLYMGLLSGAQILQKKRTIAQRLNPLSAKTEDRSGAHATYFEGQNISELKKKMRSNLDELAKSFDENTKARVLEESLKVFELNNKIVRTIKGVNQVHFKKAIVAVLFCILAYMVFKMLFS